MLQVEKHIADQSIDLSKSMPPVDSSQKRNMFLCLSFHRETDFRKVEGQRNRPLDQCQVWARSALSLSPLRPGQPTPLDKLSDPLSLVKTWIYLLECFKSVQCGSSGSAMLCFTNHINGFSILILSSEELLLVKIHLCGIWKNWTASLSTISYHSAVSNTNRKATSFQDHPSSLQVFGSRGGTALCVCL